MDVEIVFTGLCSFLNVRNSNKLMPEPSVILVQTKTHPEGDAHAGHNGKDHVHIPYLAFDKFRAQVNSPELFNESVPQTLDQFIFMRLNGFEVKVDGIPDGALNVDPNYDDPVKGVVRRDDYWPEAIDKFDETYVPKKGAQPKKSAVETFMRFGSGNIAAGSRAKVDWIFPKLDGTEFKGKFPEEVIYRFSIPGDELVVRLVDLEEPQQLQHELRFTRQPKKKKLVLHIGNNVLDDMDNAVFRIRPDLVEDGDHFKFLNLTAGILGAPKPKLGPPPKNPKPNKGGGVRGGACGPNNGNS